MIGSLILAAVVVGLLVAIYRAPVVALTTVLYMFALEQCAQAMMPFFTQHNSLINLFAGSTVIFALILMFLRGRDISFNYSSADWLVLVLFLYGFTSLLWAPNPDRGLNLWETRLPYIITTLLLPPLLITKAGDFRKIAWSLVLLGAPIVILLLIYGDWSGRKIILAGAEDDVGGNPLAIGKVAGFVALAVIFLHVGRLAAMQHVLRWLLVGACFLLAVKSGSRGQSFGIMLIAACFLPFAFPAAGMRAAVGIMAGVGALLVIMVWILSNFADSHRWTTETMGEDGLLRWDKATTLLEHWFTSPELFIFGLGNSAAFDPRIVGYYPHVVPLEILAEEGLVGLGLFLAILVLATRSLVRVYRIVKFSAPDRGAILALGALFFYHVLLCFKQGSMLGSVTLFLFAIVLNRYERVVTTGSIVTLRGVETPLGVPVVAGRDFRPEERPGICAATNPTVSVKRDAPG